jgi:hypothetical protein
MFESLKSSTANDDKLSKLMIFDEDDHTVWLEW